jgi:NhaP-type Na+/H+ or K+/H+ antiporter
MDPTLDYLTIMGIVLLIGLLVSILSKKLKISNVLPLIISGIILSKLNELKGNYFSFSPSFLIGIAIIALVLIVFDGSSRFKWREFDTLSFNVLKLILIFLIFNMIFLSAATYYIMGLNSILLAVVFAIIMSGTDPATVLTMFKTKMNRIVNILRIEAVLNTPLIILIPFIMIESININSGLIPGFIEQTYPLLQQVITGIGTGVVLGVIVFKLMKKFYSEDLSPLAMMVTALLGYLLAENLGGNGVLAVTTLGFMFGNTYMKGKESLKEFSSLFSNGLEIFVFVLLGFIIPISFSFNFLLKSLAVFAVLILTRYISILITFRKEKGFNFKNKIFMSFNASKGLAVAVIALSFSLKNIPGMTIILDLILMIMIYSIILSTIVGKLSKYFIKIDIAKANEKCLKPK